MEISSKARIVLLIGIPLVLIGIYALVKPSQPPDTGSTSRYDSPPTVSATRKSIGPNTGAVDSPLEMTVVADAKIAALIRTSLEAFRANQDPEQAWVFLSALRDGIRQATEDEAAAAIVEFLKTGEDAPTGLPFTVGPDGMMDAVPTLRIALLDLLPSLDPLAALEMAREIMARRTSPDEYALSLRNLAWNDLDGDLRNELSARFDDLLKTPWLEQPSAGFLEAFDIAVEVGGKLMFERMVDLARQTLAKSNSAASRAAFISLDRMTVRDPAMLAAAFSADAGWMEFAPQQRASLLSRLDITVPEQRELFRRYLSATSHAEGELDYFARVFPNRNYLYGHRLVTADEETPTIEEVAAADARVLTELNSVDAEVSGEAGIAIQKVRERLEKSVDR